MVISLYFDRNLIIGNKSLCRFDKMLFQTLFGLFKLDDKKYALGFIANK